MLDVFKKQKFLFEDELSASWLLACWRSEMGGKPYVYHLVKSRNGVDLGFISFTQMLKNLEMHILHILLKLGLFQLLFNGNALSAWRLGLERSKRNNIHNCIVRLYLLLYFIYFTFCVYKNCVLFHCADRLEIMRFTITHCFERYFHFKIQNQLFAFKVYNENWI